MKKSIGFKQPSVSSKRRASSSTVTELERQSRCNVAAAPIKPASAGANTATCDTRTAGAHVAGTDRFAPCLSDQSNSPHRIGHSGDREPFRRVGAPFASVSERSRRLDQNASSDVPHGTTHPEQRPSIVTERDRAEVEALVFGTIVGIIIGVLMTLGRHPTLVMMRQQSWLQQLIRGPLGTQHGLHGLECERARCGLSIADAPRRPRPRIVGAVSRSRMPSIDARHRSNRALSGSRASATYRASNRCCAACTRSEHGGVTEIVISFHSRGRCRRKWHREPSKRWERQQLVQRTRALGARCVRTPRATRFPRGAQSRCWASHFRPTQARKSFEKILEAMQA